MKKLTDLTSGDLTEHPVWRYEGESDESAIAWPVTGFDRVDEVAYIARTRFVLADGSEYWGYCSPTDVSGLDYIQPVMFIPDGVVRLWSETMPHGYNFDQVCRLLGKSHRQVFPLRYECVVECRGEYWSGELA